VGGVWEEGWGGRGVGGRMRVGWEKSGWSSERGREGVGGGGRGVGGVWEGCGRDGKCGGRRAYKHVHLL